MKRIWSLLRQRGLRSSLHQVRRSLALQGFRATWKRVRVKVRGAEGDARSIYERHGRAQAGYVRAYARSPLKAKRRMVEDLLRAEHTYRGVVLYPASYKLELRQRPEHVLRNLAADGYLCLMLTIDGEVPYVRRHGERIYATNLYEDVLTHFRQSPIVLYLTFPGHLYVARFLQRAFVIYDVLDRLQIFADFCRAMVRDHGELLERADLVLCSSPPLFEASAPLAKRTLLVPNGVYPENFRMVERPPQAPPLVVGYYGAISELLDFDLLESLADLSGVRLALAGPVVPFESRNAIELQTRTEALFSRRNVEYHGVIDYEQLGRFLAGVHCGIVPFVVNEDTDAVSPLKLFEYLAADKPVLATPTLSVRQYAPEVFVGDADAIVARVREGRWDEGDPARRAELVERHRWPNLLKPVRALIDGLEHAQPRRTTRSDVVVGARPRVDIVNISFFDWNGETVYKGGAERYVRDLAGLCRRLGFDVRILQNANFEFRRRFHDLEVIGVPIAREVDFPALSRGFAARTQGADLVIASPLELACRFFPTRTVIGINHGIHWDTRSTSIANFSLANVRLLQESLQRADCCVCVDTNFINWMRSFEWRLAQHLHYVPNYVDTDQFRSTPKDFEAPRLTALYPRRLYDPRGVNETLDAFDFLLSSTDALTLHLCGQATGADSERARRAVAKHRGRVEWYELDMEEMQQAYAQSHVVLIPTMYAEGTSLSCIEAMATNNAVVATNVGGLPNLVSDGYSGLLIRPDTWDLVAAVRRLLDDRRLAARLARNAVQVAATLAKPRWEERWTDILASVVELPLRPGAAERDEKASAARAASAHGAVQTAAASIWGE